jgi:hypothetical protein
MDVGIIVNLNARKNHGSSRRNARLRNMVAGDGVVRETRRIDEIQPVLADFIDRGVKYWVSDGGDGTLHWMINEGRKVLEERGMWEGRSPLPLVVPTNGGTIDFVAKKAGIRGHSDQVIQNLLTGLRAGRPCPTVEMDSIEVIGHRPGDPEHAPSFRRIGFAVAVGGIGQKFFSKYYEDDHPGPWAIMRVIFKTVGGYAATLSLLGSVPLIPDWLRDYGRHVLSGTRARVVTDGRVFPYELYQGLHVGAFDIDFGTVKLFRYARQPGKLHLVVGAMDPREVLYKWVSLCMGAPIPGGTWHEFPGEWLEAEARGGELLDPIIDGEMFRGFERIRVQLGPKVTVPAISRPSSRSFVPWAAVRTLLGRG